MNAAERLEEIYLEAGDVETPAWYRLTPAERFRASQELWRTFMTFRGRREPQPDSQSPFDPPR